MVPIWSHWHRICCNFSYRQFSRKKSKRTFFIEWTFFYINYFFLFWKY